MSLYFRIPEAVLEDASNDDPMVSKMRTSVEKFNLKWGPTLTGSGGNQSGGNQSGNPRTTPPRNSMQAIADSDPVRVLCGPQFAEGEEPVDVGGAFEFAEECIMQQDQVTEFFGLL